jgi:hypothetical protein
MVIPKPEDEIGHLQVRDPFAIDIRPLVTSSAIRQPPLNPSEQHFLSIGSRYTRDSYVKARSVLTLGTHGPRTIPNTASEFKLMN